MAHIIFRQPNGMFGIWLTVVDDFGPLNNTLTDLVNYNEYNISIQNLEYIIDNPDSWLEYKSYMSDEVLKIVHQETNYKFTISEYNRVTGLLNISAASKLLGSTFQYQVDKETGRIVLTYYQDERIMESDRYVLLRNLDSAYDISMYIRRNKS